MIVKYLNGNVWHYIDNVSLTANKPIDCNELIARYNDMPQPENDINDACYMNGVKLPVEIFTSNKIFTMATIEKNDWPEWSDTEDSHCLNYIDGTKALENYPAAVVIIFHDYFNNDEHFKVTAIVTNQKCFLMNDKGQTIEKLV
jgi:hypothetical protein